jgi:signal transduction histidine kinase/DNA-binding response OmpR family regulator
VLFFTILILFVSATINIFDRIKTSDNGLATLSIFQLGTIVFVSVLFYDLFNKINTIRQEKERFQELDGLKSRFFANISHEFRTPLTLIKGPLNQLAEKLPKAEDRKLLDVMRHNADRSLSLINQLLDLSKLEAGKMELQVQEIDFVALIKGITMSFESLAQRQGVALQFSSDETALALWVDPRKMEDIFNNLLSNAFKYTQSSEKVRVIVQQTDKQVTIQVKDTGKGIAPEQLPYIFDRFFQADKRPSEEAQGSGIGLALVKELVSLHGGHITVSSIEQQGTTFEISLPKGKAHLRNEDLATAPTEVWREKVNPIISDTPANNIAAPSILASDRKRHDAPLILIIEDNADVRYYIKQNLEASFRIVEAVNGQDGIDKTLEYVPDLIISDVMMPIRNGYEVCRILKADARTSHIPLILLTARAAQEEKRHGLQEGADDYLIKPFDSQELQIRVGNLIELRRKLRVSFAVGEDSAAPPDPSLNAVDKAFMQTVFDTLHKHLANEQLGVDQLAEATGMSPRHLNRKLKALTNLSANRFIRNYRLQEAMRMLKRKEGNVSEIAIATGFSSTAYFVKCFGEKFGQTPGSV